MPGRPRLPGTEAQRAAARRQQVRENVRAFRQRNRERNLPKQSESSETTRENSRRSSVAAPERSSLLQVVTQLEDDSLQQLRLTSTRDGRMINWSLELPLKLDMGPSYANAFIAAFHDRSMPVPPDQEPPTLALSLPVAGTEGQDPGVEIDPSIDTNFYEIQPSTVMTVAPPAYIRVEICFWKWTTGINFESMSEGSEMLKEALLASALGLLSIQNKDADMAVQAMHVQTRALRRLREGFDIYVKSNDKEKATLLSATALAISMSELLVNKSWDGFSVHLQGVGALIEHAGPGNLESDLARCHMQGYRTVQLPFSILNRKSTFLARSEWTNHPWRDQGAENDGDDGLHSLLDIAYRLPSLLELYDKTTGRAPSASRRQLKNLDKIASDLNDWKSDLIEEYSSTLYQSQPAFWGGLHTKVIKFHNEMVAHCFTVYVAVRIALFSLARQLADDLKYVDETSRPILSSTIAESFKWSRIACQCIEHFFASGKMAAGKLECLLAFDCAWATFIILKQKYQMDMERELLWCTSTADRIAATGLPVFRVHQAG
jgi:hypothetical protein